MGNGGGGRFHGADVTIAQLPRGDTPSDEKSGPFLSRC